MKTRCRRCRKATKVIHDSYRVCVRCMGELAKMEADLKLIEARRERQAAAFMAGKVYRVPPDVSPRNINLKAIRREMRDTWNG